ncbi:hypothetical protein T484DRAFT_1967165, partial [Baffinella frigidus]
MIRLNSKSLIQLCAFAASWPPPSFVNRFSRVGCLHERTESVRQHLGLEALATVSPADQIIPPLVPDPAGHRPGNCAQI